MLRLPLMATGLTAAAAIVVATTGALGDVSKALSGSAAATNPGPLIIQVTHSSSLAQGAADLLKQTRCLLQWRGGIDGQYDKQCQSSTLPR
jgi:hypothetical protein